MATKRSKGTMQRIVDSIGEFMRQPISDESNEVPTPATVRLAKKAAAGPRRGKTVKKTTAKKAKPAARRKKR
jgi:hypothetical protein